MDIWLSRYARLVVAATFLLILAGGLVTSHEAGLAVPDWPLSYGQFFPPMVGNIFWEHGHRMIAGTVGILTLILTLWVHWREKGIVRRLAWICLAAVVIQALLGGLTVILMLPSAVSIAHACLGQTFFCLLIALAYFLSRPHAPVEEAPAQAPRLRKLMVVTAVILYLQLILGATVRHTGNGWAIGLHVLMAFAVLFHILRVFLGVSGQYSRDFLLPWVTRLIGFLVLIQFFLGIGSFIVTRLLEAGYAPSGPEVWFTVAHQTGGALILGLMVLITLRAHQ